MWLSASVIVAAVCDRQFFAGFAAHRAALQLKTETKGKDVADYDSTPPATFDSGLTYDSAPLPQPFKRMAKPKVRLNLKEKSDSDLLLYAQQHEAAVTGNASFTPLLPAAAAFTPVRAAFATALGDFNTKQSAAKQATQVKDTARLALEGMLTQRGSYVELTAAGMDDPAAAIESAGFEVKSSKTPPAAPAPVQNLSITAGDNAGELDLQWDPVEGASTYEVQISPDPVTQTSWIPQKSVTKSKKVVLGLTSGAKMWARVCGVGPGGTGAWSDLASKIVP